MTKERGFSHTKIDKQVQLTTDNRSAAGKGLFGGKMPEQSFAVEHSFGKGN